MTHCRSPVPPPALVHVPASLRNTGGRESGRRPKWPRVFVLPWSFLPIGMRVRILLKAPFSLQRHVNVLRRDLTLLDETVGQDKFQVHIFVCESHSSTCFTAMGLGFDPGCQHIARTAMLKRLRGIPEPVAGVGEFFDQGEILPPIQLCNGALHNFPLGPRGRKGPHILQIARRNPFIIVSSLLPRTRPGTVRQSAVFRTIDGGDYLFPQRKSPRLPVIRTIPSGS